MIYFSEHLEKDKSSASNIEIIENQTKLDEEDLIEGKIWDRAIDNIFFYSLNRIEKRMVEIFKTKINFSFGYMKMTIFIHRTELLYK